MEIDFTCPQQVFDRLAQLRSEDDEIVGKISALEESQATNHEEFERLEELAVAYIGPDQDKTYRAYAHTGCYSWQRIEYALTADDSFVYLHRVGSVVDIPPLTAEQIAAALSGLKLTPTEKAACFGAAMDELMDEDDPPDVTEDEHFVAQRQDDGLIMVVARNFQPTGGH